MPDHSGHNRLALLWNSVHACHCFVVEPWQNKGCLHQDIKLGWIWHVRSLENCGVYFPRLYKKPSEDSHFFFCDFNPRFTVALVQRSLTYSEGVSVILYCECSCIIGQSFKCFCKLIRNWVLLWNHVPCSLQTHSPFLLWVFWTRFVMSP